MYTLTYRPISIWCAEWRSIWSFGQISTSAQ